MLFTEKTYTNLKKKVLSQVVVLHIFNSSTKEAEAPLAV